LIHKEGRHIFSTIDLDNDVEGKIFYLYLNGKRSLNKIHSWVGTFYQLNGENYLVKYNSDRGFLYKENSWLISKYVFDNIPDNTEIQIFCKVLRFYLNKNRIKNDTIFIINKNKIGIPIETKNLVGEGYSNINSEEWENRILIRRDLFQEIPWTPPTFNDILKTSMSLHVLRKR